MNMLKNNEQNEKEIKKFKIYAHINKSNGKIYIGQTCRDVKYRWNNGKGYIGCRHFWNAIQKYGWDNFEHIVLFEVDNQELANISEQFLIQKYKSNNPNYGYNILSGGSNMCGENNPNYGNKYSNETKKILSEISKKRLSNKQNHPRYGMHLSDETKEKIRLSNSKKYTTEQRFQKLTSDKNIHKLLMFDRNFNFLQTFLCVKDAKMYINKDFDINFNNKPFYIDDNYIFIYEDVYENVINSKVFNEAIKSYGKRYNQRPVICLNDLSIFESMTDAGIKKNVHPSKISMCCNKLRNCAGQDENLGKLLWEFYDENKVYKKQTYSRSKKCLCITTNQLFNSTKEASKTYGINQNTISWACNPNNENNRTNGGNTGFDNLFWKYA